MTIENFLAPVEPTCWIHFIRKARPKSRCYFPYYTKTSFLEEAEKLGFNRGINFLASKYMHFGDFVLFAEYDEEESEIFAVGQITILSINTDSPEELKQKLNNTVIREPKYVGARILRLAGKLDFIYEAEAMKNLPDIVEELEKIKKDYNLKLAIGGKLIHILPESLIVKNISFTHSYRAIKEKSILKVLNIKQQFFIPRIHITTNLQKHPHYIIRKSQQEVKECREQSIIVSILKSNRSLK